MAETLRKLRRRICSIRNTRKIARAMEMVSAAKFRRTEERWLSAKPYYSHLRRLIARLIFSGEEFRRFKFQHPFLQQNSPLPLCLLVISSDRGLCGAFNSNVIQKAEDFIHRQAKEVLFYCIGRRAYNYFQRYGEKILGYALDLGARFDPLTAEKIATELEGLYLKGEIGELHLLFSRFVSRIYQYPYIEKILPVTQQLITEEEELPEEEYRIDYIIEPDMQSLVDAILPAFFRAKIALSLLEAFTAEHSARMMAMSNATRNCDEMIDSLTLKMNKARQAAITKELLDIVGGAEALRKMQE